MNEKTTLTQDEYREAIEILAAHLKPTTLVSLVIELQEEAVTAQSLLIKEAADYMAQGLIDNVGQSEAISMLLQAQRAAA